MGCRSKCCAPATDGWWSLASPRRLMSTVRATAERAVWGADQSAAHPRRTAGGRWPARGASCPRSAPRLSELYGVPIKVLRTRDGRLVVVGQPEAPHVHGPRHG